MWTSTALLTASFALTIAEPDDQRLSATGFQPY